MKKIILSGIICSTLLFGDLIKVIPLDKSSLSSENGGTQSTIDAYSDGIGIVTDSKLLVDNSPLNTKVFKYGEQAKSEWVSLKDYVLDNAIVSEEISFANFLGNVVDNNIPYGTKCNDGNFLTINDTYLNWLCIEENIVGNSFNDSNIQNFNGIFIEKYYKVIKFIVL